MLARASKSCPSVLTTRQVSDARRGRRVSLGRGSASAHVHARTRQKESLKDSTDVAIMDVFDRPFQRMNGSFLGVGGSK